MTTIDPNDGALFCFHCGQRKQRSEIARADDGLPVCYQCEAKGNEEQRDRQAVVASRTEEIDDSLAALVKYHEDFANGLQALDRENDNNEMKLWSVGCQAKHRAWAAQVERLQQSRTVMVGLSSSTPRFCDLPLWKRVVITGLTLTLGALSCLLLKQGVIELFNHLTK